MKRHKRSIILLVLLLVVAISVFYIGLTYSKYTAEVEGEGTATVAKWAFADDNDNVTLDIDLTDTYDASTLVGDRIAPGTSGSFTLELTNEHSEVGVDFTVKLETVTDAPTNLKFYKDSSFTTELAQGTGTITGHLEAADSTGLEVPIYWKWNYETMSGDPATSTAGDTADTSDGEAGAELTVPVTITGVQTQPSETPITSGLDS